MPTDGASGVPRGRRLLRQRGKRLECLHAHLYETGRLRRVHLRGHTNIRKRLLVHVAGSNLGLLMRHLTGVGAPRSLQGRAKTLIDALTRACNRFRDWVPRYWTTDSSDPPWIDVMRRAHQALFLKLQQSGSATRC